MQPIPSISTQRLRLRPADRSDFDAYAAMLRTERTRFMGGPYTRQAAWDMFCKMIAGWHLDGFGGWIIDAGDERMLGVVAIWYPDHFPEPEIGWTLADAAEGKGIAFEAADAALAWYWKATGAETIVSYISPGNHRSQTLARRLGAEQDAAAPLPEGETADETLVFRHRAPA
ncbi:MAG: GNAT family N-acetyltransferase [Pseudomonadota bacterium]